MALITNISDILLMQDSNEKLLQNVYMNYYKMLIKVYKAKNYVYVCSTVENK